MPAASLLTFIALQQSYTPIWVPVGLLILILLIFVWGLTRGNVKDENLPDVAGAGSVDHTDHDEETH